MISAKNINLSLGNKKILDGAELNIPQGKLTAVIGPNGSGKSSLLKCLTGNEERYSGEIEYNGKSITSLSPEDLASSRSVVSQYYPEDIPFNAREVVSMALGEGSGSKFSFREQNEIIDSCMEEIGIHHHAKSRYSTLSGGEKQRVHIARALAQYKIRSKGNFTIFLDEPGSGLDIAAAYQFGKLVKKMINPELAVLWILHDINLALMLADNITVVKSGKAEGGFSPEELLEGSKVSEIFGLEMETHKHPATGVSSLHPKWIRE